MRLRPHEAALAALDQVEDSKYAEAAPFSRESAIRFLELFTGERFGCDTANWRKWFAALSNDELDHLYMVLEAKSKSRPSGATIRSED